MAASKFSQQVFDRICERMAEGESLRSICKTKDYPTKRTFLRWIADDETLAAQYAEAQRLRAEHYFDEIIDIADKGSDPAQTRVQIDARKWVLARMNPRKYGDRVVNEHTGEGGGPVQVVMSPVDEAL
jgi:hypothetical protein